MRKIVLIFFYAAILFSMTLTSKDFKKRIPLKEVYFMCGGSNISPELKWSDYPQETKSFAITMFDPDAPTGHGWWHWIVINIPKNVNEFPQNAGSVNSPYFNLGFEMMNDYKEIGYGGPCPPPGPPHRYIISVYALDIKKIKVKRDINPQILAEIIKEHAIDKASILGYYKGGWK